MNDPIYDSMKRRELQGKTYNDGLEAAALWHDAKADAFEESHAKRGNTDHWFSAGNHRGHAAAIRAMKENADASS